MGLGSALLRLGGVWIQSVGGVKRLIALYYGKIWMRQPLSEDENDFYSLMQHFAPYVMQPQLFISSSCRGDLEGDVGTGVLR